MEREEAIEVIKKNYPHINESGSQFETALRILIPELKESEDERVKNEIIAFVEQAIHRGGGTPIPQEQENKWLAWLEKQGKQKHTDEVEPTPIFRVGDILKRKGKDYTFRVDRIQGGYYHCDRNHGAFFPIEEQDNWELVEQKPAWSEDDEVELNGLIKHYEDGHVSTHQNRKTIKWLKSLKDRYTKPSDEQMKVCKDVYADLLSAKGFDVGTVNSEIKRLEEQLKELK